MRDLAVDEVEDVRDDHDHAGQDEAADAERPAGADVDEDADERQHVRVNPQRDARAMMSAQREHADGADRAGEGQRVAGERPVVSDMRIMEGSDTAGNAS